MGKGKCLGSKQLESFTWEDIEKRKTTDKWIVVDGLVYDITNWQKKHPGGAKILAHFIGQDATEAWTAMHPDKELVGRYMKHLVIGQVVKTKSKCNTELAADFEQLRVDSHKAGLFEADPWFYIAHLLHIVLLELAAVGVVYYFGTGWWPWLAAVLLVATSQAQAGWSQHDYGHLSVFKNSKWNHAGHYFVIGFLKGVSAHWWTFRHNQHHAKTNVFKKDPDITLPHLFLLGEHVPVVWGRKKKGTFPYQFEHLYFWLFGPAALLPVYFHLEVMYFVIKRRAWMDLAVLFTFFVRQYFFFGPVYGGWGTFGLYMAARFFESFWFTMVTQMSHIPMEIDYDQHYDWVTGQAVSTCNVEEGLFNDWFTGHLNFQIEHHLFPTMPRHHYHKVAPQVKKLFKKHNLPYTVKPLLTAFADISRSLKTSGELWYDAYYHT